MTSPECSPETFVKLKGEANVYSETSLSVLPTTNNLLPSLLKTIASAPVSKEVRLVAPI